MKTLLTALLNLMLIIAIVPVIVSAADITQDPNYGTALNITTDYQFPTADYLGKGQFDAGKDNTVWSPDGKSIVFSSAGRLWIVSSEGGNAEFLYGTLMVINDVPYTLGFPTPIAFTPDGKEVIFSEAIFDEERGSEIIAPDGSGHFANCAFDIFAIDIETKVTRLIVSNGYNGTLSKDGKYLCYLNYDWKSNVNGMQLDHHKVPTILNLETGELRYLSNDEKVESFQFAPIFSADGSYVICRILDNSSTTEKIIKYPVSGGNPEPFTFFDDTGVNFFPAINISPDWSFTLYSEYVKTVSDSVPDYDDNGNYIGYHTFTSAIWKAYVYNNETGDKYYLLPSYLYVDAQGFTFSPDGSKICYVIKDLYDDAGYKVFVKNFDVNTLEKISVISAVQTNGPEQFATIKNYPNPFNPSTTIEFNLTKPEYANLSVYNLTGQKVCELASGEMTAGKRSYVWNGRDSNGTPVSSGIFFTRLETRDNVISNRMMLVK